MGSTVFIEVTHTISTQHQLWSAVSITIHQLFSMAQIAATVRLINMSGDTVFYQSFYPKEKWELLSLREELQIRSESDVIAGFYSSKMTLHPTLSPRSGQFMAAERQSNL